MSFRRQASWNASAGLLGQVVAVAFVGFTARLLAPVDFGYFIWATALPGMVVVFDLYLGQSLQTRLTELIATQDNTGRDALIWGFFWGMLAASLAFLTLVVLIVVVVAAWSSGSSVAGVPETVLWLGVAQVAAVSLNVPLLTVGLGYNAYQQTHRGTAWSLVADSSSRIVFLSVLASTRSLELSIVAWSAASVTSNVCLFVRFTGVYDIRYIGPSRRVVRAALGDLFSRGQGQSWAALRVVDGFYKNSELIIGTFVIGPKGIGDFALLDRLSNALMLFANAAYLPLAPALTSARALGNNARAVMLQRRIGQYSLVVLVVYSVAFLTVGPWIASQWAGRPIAFAFPILVLMCVRACVRVLSTLRWHLLMGHKLIQGLLWSTVGAGVVYGVLYASLVVRYGVISILISQTAAHFVFLALASRYSRRDRLANDVRQVADGEIHT